MEEKKYIKISFSTAICIAIIIILMICIVCLGLYTYKLKNSGDEKNNNVEEQLTQNILYIDENKNLTENQIVDIGEEININNNMVKKLIDKINFNTYAKASIYKFGDFDVDTIPNDLVLRLGWDKIDSSNKNTYVDEANQDIKETLTSELMKKSIANIFGNKVKYMNDTFRKVDVAEFYNYQGYTDEEHAFINYNNNLYTASMYQGGGLTESFIYEEVQKALKYDEKIEIYVKTMFIKPLENLNYIIYKNFNFDTNNFEEQVGKIEESDFYNEAIDENNNISLKANPAVSKILGNLNTYVYTFELNDDGEYYFSAFNIAE